MGISMSGGGDSSSSGYQPPATQPYTSPPPPPPNPVRPPQQQQQRSISTVGGAAASLWNAPAATAVPSLVTAVRQLFGGGGQSSPVYGSVSQNRVTPPPQRPAASLPSPRPAPMPPPSPTTVRQPFGSQPGPPIAAYNNAPMPPSRPAGLIGQPAQPASMGSATGMTPSSGSEYNPKTGQFLHGPFGEDSGPLFGKGGGTSAPVQGQPAPSTQPAAPQSQPGYTPPYTAPPGGGVSGAGVSGLGYSAPQPGDPRSMAPLTAAGGEIDVLDPPGYGTVRRSAWRLTSLLGRRRDMP
jgi:hypothetical protein